MKNNFISDAEINRGLKFFSRVAPGTAMSGYPINSKNTKINTIVHNSFYFSLFITHGVEKVSNWADNVSLSEAHRIIFPVFRLSHWSLCVIYTKHKVCVLFDPLRPMHYNTCSALLLHPGVDIVIYHGGCSQQPNMYDCGPYTVYYAGCIILRRLNKINDSVPGRFIDIVRR